MPDRLAELLRQRALLQEHLAWLDREIADASNQSAAAPSPVAVPPSPVASAAAPHPDGAMASSPSAHLPAADPPPPSSAAVFLAPPGVDPILEQYRAPPGALQSDLRKGCFLYFALALVLLALGVIALYFMISTR